LHGFFVQLQGDHLFNRCEGTEFDQLFKYKVITIRWQLNLSGSGNKTVNFGFFSKYPPAKPEALVCEPLKAA